jgi:hypothetical protein
MPKSLKRSFVDLIDDIDWVSIAPQRAKIDAAEVYLSYNAKKGSNTVDQCTVFFGADILKELGWEKGDRIGVAYAPDNVFNMRLHKRPHTETSERKLKFDVGSRGVILTFKWPHPTIQLPTTKRTPVEFFVHRSGYLVINGRLEAQS